MNNSIFPCHLLLCLTQWLFWSICISWAISITLSTNWLFNQLHVPCTIEFFTSIRFHKQWFDHFFNIKSLANITANYCFRMMIMFALGIKIPSMMFLVLIQLDSLIWSKKISTRWRLIFCRRSMRWVNLRSNLSMNLRKIGLNILGCIHLQAMYLLRDVFKLIIIFYGPRCQWCFLSLSFWSNWQKENSIT